MPTSWLRGGASAWSPSSPSSSRRSSSVPPPTCPRCRYKPEINHQAVDCLSTVKYTQLRGARALPQGAGRSFPQKPPGREVECAAGFVAAACHVEQQTSLGSGIYSCRGRRRSSIFSQGGVLVGSYCRLLGARLAPLAAPH